jgi:hypothetical protein
MLELTVRIVEENKEVKVPFYVNTLPPVSPRGHGRTMSTWTCFSPHLGKGYTGEYWIETFQMPSCGDMYWIECDKRTLTNPVALFRDYGAMSPFLALYGFTDPANMLRRWEHADRFYEEPRIIRSHAIHRQPIAWMAARGG